MLTPEPASEPFYDCEQSRQTVSFASTKDERYQDETRAMKYDPGLNESIQIISLVFARLLFQDEVEIDFS